MKSSRSLLVPVLAATLTLLRSGAADIQPPQLADFNLDPVLVDTSDSNQTISVTIRITDDDTGIGPSAGSAHVSFRSPSMNQYASLYLTSTARVSGNERDGIYVGALTLPRFSEPGDWKLTDVDLSDASWNRRNLERADLLVRDFPAQFTVQGTGDTTPPQLLSFELSPTTLDITASEQVMTVTARITDDLAGFGHELVTSAFATFLSPSRNQFIEIRLSSSDRVSGDALDGVYTASVVLPQYSEPGVWTLDHFSIVDEIGNGHYARQDQAVFLARDLASQFTVQGDGDTTPPELLDFALSVTNTGEGSEDQILTIRARVTDDLIGFAEPRARCRVVLRPSTNDWYTDFDFSPENRISGDKLDGMYENTRTLANLEPGVWRVDSLDIADALGNRRSLEEADLLARGFPARFAVATSEMGGGSGTRADVTPPELVSFGFSPMNVDPSTADQVVLLTARVSDDLSGIASTEGYLSCGFSSPSGNQVLGCGLNWTHRVSGNETDGVYERAVLVPQFSEPGRWTLECVSIRDAAGNRAELDLPRLLARGLSSYLTVQGTGDTTAPQLLGLEFSPTVLDPSASSQVLTVTAHLSDDLSGLGSPGGGAWVYFRSPSRNQSVNFELEWFDRTSGNSLDAIYTRAVLVPKLSEPGVWTLEGIQLADSLRNWRAIDLPELLARGLPTQFTVSGTGDGSPPELVSLAYLPTILDTSTTDQAMTFTLRVTDDLAGFGPPLGSGEVFFYSPSRNEGATVRFECSDRVSGDAFDGTYEAAMLLPEQSEPGVWTLSGITLIDALGNRKQMDLAQFLPFGLPCQFTVVNRPALRITRFDQALLLSWPSSATGFVLQSTDDLSGGALWMNVTVAPVVWGQDRVVVLTPSAAQNFFRLNTQQ